MINNNLLTQQAASNAFFDYLHYTWIFEEKAEQAQADEQAAESSERSGGA